MKFSEYQAQLDEAFDTPVKIDRRNLRSSHFRIDDVEYMIEYYDNYEGTLDVSFMARDVGEAAYKYTLRHSDTKTALKVFSTVISETQHRIDNAEVEYSKIKFSAFEDDDKKEAAKRARLYKRMAERFAANGDWKLRVYGGDSFVLTKTVKLPDATGYSKSFGQEHLDLYNINDAAIIEVIGQSSAGVWSLANNERLRITNGVVSLSSGSIQSLDSWWDAFHELEWYDEENGEQFYDTNQRICEIAGKIWVVGDMTITVWPTLNALERESDMEVSSVTSMMLEF
ncbi:hypothetical protein VPHF86_0144 [Vibrio phage F86]